MRNELAREYDLPNRGDLSVTLDFEGNHPRFAWRVLLQDVDGGRKSVAYGATPKRTYDLALADYDKD